MNIQAADKVFNALGDATRRAIVGRLSRAECSVSELAQPLNVTLTAVRQHLHILEDCGLVRTQKQGRVRTCRLVPGGFSVVEDWIRFHRSHWDSALDRLGEALDDNAAD